MRAAAVRNSAIQSERNRGNKYGLGNKRTPEGQARVTASITETNRRRPVTEEYREKRRQIAIAMNQSKSAEWKAERARKMAEGYRRALAEKRSIQPDS